MAYRVAFCDDNAVDAQYVRAILCRWAQMRGMELVCREFSSAERFLWAYAEEKRWDLLLLDIEMAGMDGVTMAKTVRRDNEAVQIVFITGYSDYIAEGYEVAALHYLTKPVREEKLFAVLDRALEKRRQNERCLNLELGGEMLRIPLHEIRYLDVQLTYVPVHAKRSFTVKRSLSEFEKELDSRFFRAGRSLIVNLSAIRMVTKTELLLASGERLPLPRGAYEPLNRAIIERT